MLLELIARYYKFLWIGFATVAFLKILLSYSFNRGFDGFAGFIVALFKWYGEDDREIEEFSARRTMMRLMNIVTCIEYIFLFLILVAFLLPKFLGR